MDKNNYTLLHQKCFSERQINILNGELMRSSRSITLAYILLIFLGFLGLHKLYLGKRSTAIVYAVSTVIGLLTISLKIGIFLLAAVAAALLWDLFTLPVQIKNRQDKIREDLINQFKE